MAKSEKACAECKHVEAPAGSGELECRRMPPLPVVAEVSQCVVARWPVVNKWDWCSHFQRSGDKAEPTTPLDLIRNGLDDDE